MSYPKFKTKPGANMGIDINKFYKITSNGEVIYKNSSFTDCCGSFNAGSGNMVVLGESLVKSGINLETESDKIKMYYYNRNQK